MQKTQAELQSMELGSSVEEVLEQIEISGNHLKMVLDQLTKVQAERKKQDVGQRD